MLLYHLKPGAITRRKQCELYIALGKGRRYIESGFFLKKGIGLISKRLIYLFCAALWINSLSVFADAGSKPILNDSIDQIQSNAFYFGAGVGTNILNYTFTDISTLLSIPIIKSRLFGQGISGHFVAGYEAGFNQFSLGFEAFGGYSSQSMNSVKIFGPGGGFRDVQLKSTWSAGGSILPGFFLSSNKRLFLRLGAIDSNFISNIVGLGSYHYDKNRWGGQIGVGGEFSILNTKNLSLRGEYIYTTYQNWNNVGRFICTAGHLHNANINIVSNVVQLTIVHRFV